MEIWRTLAVMSLTIGTTCGSLLAQADRLTGVALERAVRAQAVSGNWTQAPLGVQLRSFSQAQNISIILDRRVDSSQWIELRAVDLTVEQFLWRVAQSVNLGVCQVGDSFYIGPPDVAAVLPGMLDQLQSQSLKAAKGWKKSVTLGSDQPFEPAMQLKSICEASGLSIENLERVPLDIWAPVQWPTAPAYQNIALLLVGFGLWPECHDARLHLVEFRIPSMLTRQFRLPDQVGLGKQIEELRENFPQADLQPAKSGVNLTADAKTMHQFAETVAFLFEPTTGTDSNKRYTLKTNAMRGSILATIAQQAGLELTYPAEAKTRLSERIQVNLEQVPLAELLESTLKDSGLEFEIQERKLMLRIATEQGK